MSLKALWPYLVWTLIVVVLGPPLLWFVRTNLVFNAESMIKTADATATVYLAFQQLSSARMMIEESAVIEQPWPDEIDEWDHQPETRLYTRQPDVVGVEFLEHKTVDESLVGTRIEYQRSAQGRWRCMAGEPPPPQQLLPVNCGGRPADMTHLLDKVKQDRWWLLAFLLTVLVCRYLITQVFYNSALKALKDNPEGLAMQPLGALAKISSGLKLRRQLDSRLRKAGIGQQRWQQAVSFATQSANVQCRTLARRLGATISSVDQGRAQGKMFSWTFNPDSPVMLNRCRVFIPSPTCREQALRDVLSELANDHEVLIVIQVSDEDNRELQLLANDKVNALIMPDPKELSAILLKTQPEITFIRTLARQLPLSRISPYQTRGGLTRAARFFGRERELTRILHRDLCNTLLIGGRQLGKTSLLKELERRYSQDDTVQTCYLSLRDHRLRPRLAGFAELDSETGLTEVITTLSHRAVGRRLIIMVDEADLFIRHEREHDYPCLNEVRSLSDEGIAHFMFAGFWDLYESAIHDYQSPVRNFGETIHVGALDYAACHDMIVKPTASLGLCFEDNDLVDEIIRSTGRRPNLLAIVCQQCLDNLNQDELVISRERVQHALRSDSVSEALAGWGRLTSDTRASRLDRIIIYRGLLSGAVELALLVRLFEDHEITVDIDEIRHSLMRLQLAFILRKTDVGYSFAVPLLRRELSTENVDLLLNQELDGLKQ